MSHTERLIYGAKLGTVLCAIAMIGLAIFSPRIADAFFLDGYWFISVYAFAYLIAPFARRRIKE